MIDLTEWEPDNRRANQMSKQNSGKCAASELKIRCVFALERLHIEINDSYRSMAPKLASPQCIELYMPLCVL